MANIGQEHVLKAYAALGTLDEKIMSEYWDENMVWLVPGHNPLSGWYHGRTAFVNFMKRVGELSGGSFNMEPITIMTNDEYSCDVTRNMGSRSGMPEVGLDIDVAHVLRWRNGKVIAGKGGIFGDGTDQYDHFWGARS